MANVRLIVSRTVMYAVIGACLGLCLAGAGIDLRACEAAGPVDARTAYNMAAALAAKWQPDAKPCNFTTLATGPVDGEGRSAQWSIHFSSKKAGKLMMVTVSSGQASTFVVPGPGARVIAISPKTNLDSKQLLARADAAGGAAHRKKGALVTIGLVESPVAGVGPLWHISYSAKGPDGMPGRELFHVAIEGNTGKLSVL